MFRIHYFQVLYSAGEPAFAILGRFLNRAAGALQACEHFLKQHFYPRSSLMAFVFRVIALALRRLGILQRSPERAQCVQRVFQCFLLFGGSVTVKDFASAS